MGKALVGPTVADYSLDYGAFLYEVGEVAFNHRKRVQVSYALQLPSENPSPKCKFSDGPLVFGLEDEEWNHCTVDAG